MRLYAVGSQSPSLPSQRGGALPEKPNLHMPCLMNVIVCFIVTHSVQKFASKGNFREKNEHLCNKEEIVEVPREARRRNEWSLRKASHARTYL